MYNLEVVDERGQPRVVSFRMPTLVKQSVYHLVSSCRHRLRWTGAIERRQVAPCGRGDRIDISGEVWRGLWVQTVSAEVCTPRWPCYDL